MVLLVIDTQTGIVTDDLYECDTFVRNVAALISTARSSGTEVIYVRHDDGEELTKGIDDFEIYNQFSPHGAEKIFDKTVNSPFRNTGLLAYLTEKEEREVMVVGLQTDFCMDATIKCGFEHGLSVIVPAHCNTTVDNAFMTGEQSYRYYNEKMWNVRYANCVSFDDAMSMLLASERK